MAAILEEQTTNERSAELDDRLGRLENEVGELRQTLSELAGMVVGDIKERRELTAAISAPASQIPIPESLAPGGKLAIGAFNAMRRPWLLIDLFKELWAVVRMYIDPRYRVRRATQMMMPIVLALIVANYFFFNMVFWSIPVVSPILETLVTIILAILLYKILSREVGRYRLMLAHIAASTGSIRSVPAALLNTDHDSSAPLRQEVG